MSDAVNPKPSAPNRITRLVTSTWAVLRDVFSRPSGCIGLCLIAVHLFLAIFGPLIVPHDPLFIDPDNILGPPDGAHWLGTDELGRDVLSRTITGGRVALLITGIATPLAILWGGFLGIFLGLRGGRLDDIIMRFVDALLAMPGILPVLVILVIFGTGTNVLIPTLAFFFGIPVIRIARAAAHDVVAREFVLAAKARGHSLWSITWREVMPNVLDTLFVEGAMRWSWMLLGFSALSFLGFGVTPPTPDWGLMISNGRIYMYLTVWFVLAPIIALSSLIIGINLTADALAKSLGIDRMKKVAL